MLPIRAWSWQPTRILYALRGPWISQLLTNECLLLQRVIIGIIKPKQSDPAKRTSQKLNQLTSAPKLILGNSIHTQQNVIAVQMIVIFLCIRSLCMWNQVLSLQTLSTIGGTKNNAVQNSQNSSRTLLSYHIIYSLCSQYWQCHNNQQLTPNFMVFRRKIWNSSHQTIKGILWIRNSWTILARGWSPHKISPISTAFWIRC
jgi:hypothetical protein